MRRPAANRCATWSARCGSLGNLAHYSPDQPHVLIDGLPQRAPWVDLADMRAKGALLVWDVGDLQKLPGPFAALAPNAKVGTPFTLPTRRIGKTLEHVGWAILDAAVTRGLY